MELQLTRHQEMRDFVLSTISYMGDAILQPLFPAQVRTGEPLSNSSFVNLTSRTTAVRLVPKVKNQNNRKQPHLRFWARDRRPARRKDLTIGV